MLEVVSLRKKYSPDRTGMQMHGLSRRVEHVKAK